MSIVVKMLGNPQLTFDKCFCSDLCFAIFPFLVIMMSIFREFELKMGTSLLPSDWRQVAT